MATVYIAPTFGVGFQAFDAAGVPLNAGLLYSYSAGTTTPLATYTASDGVTPNANPIVLGADGRPPNEIWMTAVSYRFDLKDSLGNTLASFDNVPSGFVSASTLAASTGAAGVGFVQSGIGAVAGNAQDELRTWVRPEQFGAVADGITDDTAAIQAALTKLKTDGGGTLILQGNKKYLCASQLSLASTKGIRIRGQSSSTQTSGGSVISYSGTATPFISFSGIASVELQDVNVQYTSGSFTGTLVAVPTCTGVTLRDATLMGNGVSTALYLLDLDTSVEVNLISSIFQNSQYAISGQNSGGTGYCNGANIDGCTFSGLTTGSIRNPGQGWAIGGGTVFEALSGGTGNAIVMDAACTALGTSINGIWCGDATSASAFTWITWQGKGLTVNGSYLHGTGNLASTAIKILGTSYGIEISGNTMDHHSVAVNIGSFLVNSCSIHGNDTSSTTTYVSGTPVSNYFDARDGTFTPAFTNLTVVLGGGSVTYSGWWQKIGLTVHFEVTISPAGGATTASSASATNINNLPFATGAGIRSTCTAIDVSTNASLGVGLVTAATAYTPTWSATSDVITIAGTYRTAA